MYDKKHDPFFDETKTSDSESEKLMKMIEASEKTVKSFSPGMNVSGKVSRIGSEYVFVEIGAKNEAMIKVAELKTDGGDVSVCVGDTVEGFIISEQEGEILVSKSMNHHNAGMEELMDALENKIPVQGKVTGINKGGLNVKIMGKKAFCPVSQIDIKFTSDINEYLGKQMDFVITRITEGGRNIVVSRIPVLELGIEDELNGLQKAVENRTVLKGAITKIADFGLFVQVGNLEGLVHISEVSWERAENLSESFVVGQEVEVMVLKLERKGQLKNLKLSLSIKQVFENPWTSIADKLSIGSSVTGKVTRLADFGAFVEILPGVEGLVHISEMSWGKRVNHPSEVVKPAQSVKVTVLGINEDKRSVSLSLKDLTEDPWNDIESNLPVGTEVNGTVAKKAQYGYFVDLLEGITGLLVNQKIESSKKESVKVGEQVTVRIDSIDTESRRVSLSMGLADTATETKETRQFIKKQNSPKKRDEKGSATDFGAALMEALKSKK